MNKHLRYFTIILSVCLVLCFALFVACDNNTATVTLDVGAGGTLDKTVYETKVGASVKELVKDILPQCGQGVTFAGWYIGDKPVGDSDTVEGDMTLTAQYDAEYTVNIYYSDASGLYPSTPSDVQKGTARLGSSFSFDVSKLNGTLDASKQNRTSTDSLGKNEVFTVYMQTSSLEQVNVRVNYNVNRDDVTATIPSADVLRGTKVTLPDGEGYGLGRSLRFLGWALTSEGEVVYKAGDIFDTGLMKGYNTTLYAKWQEGLTDVFGGDDYLFVDDDEQQVILRREGLEEKRGAYNSATGVFSFKEGDNTVLEGKVSQDRFYYFEDLTDKTATSGLGNGDTILFNGSDSVTYTHGETVVEGTYDMDFVTGEYVFVSQSENFHFTVNTQNGVLVFNRSTSDEAGFYAMNSGLGDSVLYLDGMVDANGIGGAMLYSVEKGNLNAVTRVFYSVWEQNVRLDNDEIVNYYKFDTKTYAIFTADADSPIFLFRVTDGDHADVDGVHIRGSYVVSDDANGYYYTDAMDEQPDLFVDGFGNVLKEDGKGGQVKGTYEIESNELQIVENRVLSDWADEWLKITYEGQADAVYERIYYNLVPLHYNISRPKMIQWANSAQKTYVGAPDYVNMWIYDSTINGAYILGEAYDRTYGTYYESLDRGEVKELGDGLFQFTSAIYTGADSNWQFRYDGEKIVTTVAGAEGFGTKGDVISMDKWGTLTYNNVEYAFGNWSKTFMYDIDDRFVLEFYQFKGLDKTVGVRVDVTEHVDGDELTYEYTRTLLAKDAVIDIVWNQFYGQEGYYDKLYFIDSSNAAVGLINQYGEYDFYLFGTVTQNGDTDEYHFVADASKADWYVEQIGATLANAYSDFYFKYSEKDGVKVAVKSLFGAQFTAKNGATFKKDAYGNAEFKPADDDNVIAGTYDELDMLGKYLFKFASNDGKTEHLISVIYDGEDVVDFLVDADGAGIYYYLYSTGEVYFDTYMVLLGDETADHAGTVVYGSNLGTYHKTDKTVRYNFVPDAVWTEYQLDLMLYDSENKPVPTSINIIVSSITFDVNTEDGITQVEYPCFVEQMDRQADRNFQIVGGGQIVGDGYNDTYYFDGSTYYYGVLGIGVIKDGSPLMSDYDWDDDFENGEQLIFRASYIIVNGNPVTYSNSFLFDINDDNTLSLRDEYNGTYALYDKGNITQSRMYLDGHGNATLSDADGNVRDKGTYTVMNMLDCLMFTSDSGETIRFNTAQMSFSDETWLLYYVIEDERVFVNDDWSVLLLGSIREDDELGMINALYVDAKGRVRGGFYSQLSDDVVRFQFAVGGYSYYSVQNGKFTVITDEFIIRDNVLVGYQGSYITHSLRIPDGVTEIGSNAFGGVVEFGGSTYTLDLNQVERIDDYAFYGVHNFGIADISSEKVTYVGNYAFYVPYFLEASIYDDLPTSWIINVNLPNVTYIGDYAFNGCNQMNLGITKLNKVTYIGAYAFSHNTFPEDDDRMILDLTEADVTQIKMDRNAFLPGPNTNHWENLGWPVTIWVSDEQAKQYALDNWFEEIANRVFVKEPTLENEGYYNFETGDYIAFGKATEGEGAVTYYTRDEDTDTYTSSDYGTYSFEGYSKVTVTLTGGSKVEFGYSQASVEFDGKTFLRTHVMHNFDVTDESGAEVSFSMSFGVYIQDLGLGDGAYDLTFSADDAVYNGFVATNVIVQSGAIHVTYNDQDQIFNITIDMSTWTAKVVPAGVVVFSADGNYRASLDYPLNDGYLYLTLEQKQSDGSFQTVFEDVNRSDVNLWRKSILEGQDMASYTVTYDPGKNVVTVNKVVLKQLELTDSEGLFRVTFGYADDGQMEVLFKLDEKNEYGSFENVYNVRGMTFATVEKTGDNEFTVTNNLNGVRTWVIRYSKADGKDVLTVTKTVIKVVRVQSDHVEDVQENIHEDYFDVALLVDEEGNVVGIAEIKEWNYNSSYGTYYDDATIIPTDVQQQGNTFTFKSGVTVYTVTVTATDDGYSVTVQKK